MSAFHPNRISEDRLNGERHCRVPSLKGPAGTWVCSPGSSIERCGRSPVDLAMGKSVKKKRAKVIADLLSSVRVAARLQAIDPVLGRM
jgi:hypothetical protein